MTVLHVMRDPSTTRNQTPPKGLTSATTLKKSSSKTGTVSEHCTTLGLLARDPNSCRSGISLWARVELLLRLVPSYSPGCPPTPQQGLSALGKANTGKTKSISLQLRLPINPSAASKSRMAEPNPCGNLLQQCPTSLGHLRE